MPAPMAFERFGLTLCLLRICGPNSTTLFENDFAMVHNSF